jgi:hypothetical protein
MYSPQQTAISADDAKNENIDGKKMPHFFMIWGISVFVHGNFECIGLHDGDKTIFCLWKQTRSRQ